MFTFSLCVFNGFHISGILQVILQVVSALHNSIFLQSPGFFTCQTVSVSATSGLEVLVDVCEK